MATARTKPSVTKSAVYKPSGQTVVWDSLTDSVTDTWDNITGTWDSVKMVKTAINKPSITKSAIAKP